MAKPERLSWEVHLDAPELNQANVVGWLHQNLAKTAVPASFEYKQEWLKSEGAFMLDPRLELWRGEQHPPATAPAFGIFMDSAPDRWGRVLMERREAAAAEREGRPMRTLREMDFLLGVHDEVRMGALRFKDTGNGPFVDQTYLAAPPVTSLRELADISRRIEDVGIEKLPEYERWLSMLVAPGSSLGGARPKANFRQADGSLWIAKFPAKDDRYDIGAWEQVLQILAVRAGINMPEAHLEALSPDYRTYCSRRFDRTATGRRMYASAMTLLERQDGEAGGSYLDLAEFISDYGARHQVEADLHQLFRRVVFNVLVGNRDDHLRNHGFLRVPSGWVLSPAFDLNPSIAKAEHALTFDGKSAEPSITTVLSTAELYRLSDAHAQEILVDVQKAVAEWKAVASQLGLGRGEVQRMEAVFKG
ncbi:HipA domain-containing protein [uncultured Rhodoferax sp.]|uniref:type II toxin-antitoxin system HipA family toxin n=1 Tax=uncultured Rhodoferax sp. TaxID=223188 RepID=UPI0025CBB50B|nr:HipA domain-containing protein [uncultured Rhodoferax sp.]